MQAEMLSEYTTEEYEFVQLIIDELEMPTTELDAAVRKTISIMLQELSTQLVRRTSIITGHRYRMISVADDFYFAIQSLLRNSAIYIPALLDSETDTSSDKDDESITTSMLSCGDDELSDIEDEDYGEGDRDIDLEENSEESELDFGEDLEFDELTDESYFVEGTSEHKMFKYLSALSTEIHCSGMFTDHASTLQLVQAFHRFLVRELKLSYHGNPESVFTRVGMRPLRDLLLEYRSEQFRSSQVLEITGRLVEQENLFSQEQLQSNDLIETLKSLISVLKSSENLACAMPMSLQSPRPESAGKSTSSTNSNHGIDMRSIDAIKTPSMSSHHQGDPVDLALKGMATQLKDSQQKMSDLEADLNHERWENSKLLRKLTNMKALIASLHVLSEDLPTPVGKFPDKEKLQVGSSTGSAFSTLKRPLASKSAISSSQLAAATAAAAAATNPFSGMNYDKEDEDHNQNFSDPEGESPIDRLVASSEGPLWKRPRLKSSEKENTATIYLHPSSSYSQYRPGSSSEYVAEGFGQTPNLFRKTQ